MLQAPKGTKDILPSEIETWHFMEKAAAEVFGAANFSEIRTPVFEVTQLFSRGVGESTDIVNKEMYTFEKSDRSLTLRPENTAGVVRAYIENGFSRVAPPVKLWYKGPMFRYERPQAGRQRQFHQIGVEMFGESSPAADAECILLAVNYLKKLGLTELTVELNSLGCTSCRTEYKSNLKKAFEKKLPELCEDCAVRYEKNPLRILDCKNENCAKIFETDEIKTLINTPFICEDCKEHFEKLCSILKDLNIKFTVNPRLVRGLDYYNRTVFEIKAENLGSQNAVCGGGRYDGLVEMLGGAPTPAVGWAMGMERLSMLLPKIEPPKLDYFVVSDNTNETFLLVNQLREMGYVVDYDYRNRKFAKQLEKAVKTAKTAIILCENEINSNTITVKDIESATQQTLARDEFFNQLREKC